MNRYYIKNFIFMVIVSFYTVTAMEIEPVSMVERKAMSCALAKLSFGNNEKILHIGSHCKEIMRKKFLGFQVYCIDTKMLSCLEEPVQKNDKNLSFVCWDGIKNPQEACVNSARLLKSNEQFCVVVPYYRSPYLTIYKQTFMSDEWKHYYDKNAEVCIYNSGRIKNILVKAGFDGNVDCTVIKKPFIFKTKELFMEWIRLCPGQLNSIPQEHRAAFINDVVVRYLQKHPLTEKNTVTLYFPYMIVRGYKF